MNSREKLKSSFLANIGYNHYIDLTKIPPDASFRSYERLIFEDKTLILMDAPPDKERVTSFINVNNFLFSHNFSVPKIIAQDEINGFLLLEDFGNAKYSIMVKDDIDNEEYLYRMAINAIVKLQDVNIPSQMLKNYDEQELLREALLLTQWYLPIINGEELSEKLIVEYQEILISLFQHLKDLENVVVLRDYHADNLMWLEDREGIARVGILDFQDAVIGSPVYDVMSLLSDVRRDVSPNIIEQMINHYLELKTNISRKDFLASYAILSVQRNLKIIGIVARKVVRDKNSAYLHFLPRAWKHVEQDLKHPLLLPLKMWLNKIVSHSVSGGDINNRYKIIA